MQIINKINNNISEEDIHEMEMKQTLILNNNNSFVDKEVLNGDLTSEIMNKYNIINYAQNSINDNNNSMNNNENNKMNNNENNSENNNKNNYENNNMNNNMNNNINNINNNNKINNINYNMNNNINNNINNSYYNNINNNNMSNIDNNYFNKNNINIINMNNNINNNDMNNIMNNINNYNNNNINNNNMNNMNNNMINKFKEMDLKNAFIFNNIMNNNNLMNNIYMNQMNNTNTYGFNQMNLNNNINYYLGSQNAKVIEQKNSPIYPHKTGLQNIGQTCYMNSTIQCLSNIKYLSDYLIKHYGKYEIFDIKSKPLSIAFSSLVYDLFTTKKKYIAPNLFKKIIGKLNPLFEGNHAADAKDLIFFLLETLHKELNKKR